MATEIEERRADKLMIAHSLVIQAHDRLQEAMNILKLYGTAQSLDATITALNCTKVAKNKVSTAAMGVNTRMYREQK